MENQGGLAMNILGFTYGTVFSSDAPMKVEFVKDHETQMKKIRISSVGFIQNGAILNQEANINIGDDVLIVYDGGMIAGFVEKINVRERKFRVGDFWVTDDQDIYMIGIDTPLPYEDDEDCEDDEYSEYEDDEINWYENPDDSDGED